MQVILEKFLVLKSNSPSLSVKILKEFVESNFSDPGSELEGYEEVVESSDAEHLVSLNNS
jgi:hypothetical protein